MKTKVEQLEGSKVKIEVVLTKEEFNEKYEVAFEKILKDVEVKGFRKGKVPREMYLKRFGDGAVIRDAIDLALNDSYFEAVTKKDIKVVGQPDIDIDWENVGHDKPFKYTATVEVYPLVTLGKYFGVEVSRESDEITVNELEDEINRTLKNNSELELVETGKLEKGYTAIFDFCGYLNGEEFEGGKAENYTLEIGSGQFIPGFEDQMVGMTPEEEKDINVTFPKDYQAENLAGKDVVFKVKLHEMKKRVLPTLDDEFIKGLEVEGVNTVEEWKQNIKDTLSKEKKEANDNKFTDDLITAVCNDAKVDIPKAMIENRVNQMVSQVENQAKAYGLTVDQLLSYQGTTLEQYKELVRPSAEKNVLESLVIEAVRNAEKIKLNKEDYEKYYAFLAKQYNQTVEQVQKSLPKERVGEYFLDLKTIDLLKEKAIIK